MAGDDPKILIDDDWKAEARREKERLAEEVKDRAPADSAGGFLELINLIVMQTMAAMGMLTGPGGERFPTDLVAARHFIEMLHALEIKTKGNLSAEEQTLMTQVLYEMRMRYVQLSGTVPPTPESGATPPSPQGPPS